MKRNLAALLALTMLLPGLAGCAAVEKEDETPAAGTPSPENEIEETLPEETEGFSDGLEDTDFGGRVYTVLYRDEAEHLREITAEELTGDVINDAIFNRTAEIQQRFNMVLGLLSVSEGNLNNTFSNAVSAGDRNVYFVDGYTVFAGDLEDECTVEWCHPNDLGMRSMAGTVL